LELLRDQPAQTRGRNRALLSVLTGLFIPVFGCVHLLVGVFEQAFDVIAMLWVAGMVDRSPKI
jgi:hypothetical protein